MNKHNACLMKLLRLEKWGEKTGLRRIDDVLDDVFTDICDRQDNPEKHRGLKTGFKDFDRLLSPKQIVIGSLFS
ncbi:hypothetical protein ACVXG7_03625 [Enterobacter hormaechei]